MNLLIILIPILLIILIVTKKESFHLAIPNKCGRDQLFSGGMYHPCQFPSEWGRTFSTGPCAKAFTFDRRPSLVKSKSPNY